MTSRTTRRFARAALLSSTIFATAHAMPAIAQDTEEGASTGNDDGIIVVTATRREASVQDIPLNIAAVGSAQIEEQGLTELSDLLPFVPGTWVAFRGEWS